MESQRGRKEKTTTNRDVVIKYLALIRDRTADISDLKSMWCCVVLFMSMLVCIYASPFTTRPAVFGLLSDLRCSKLTQGRPFRKKASVCIKILGLYFSEYLSEDHKQFILMI